MTGANVKVLSRRRGLARQALFVVIAGPDGTGKSSITKALSERMPADVRHWRPGVLPRLGKLAGQPMPDFTKPHASAPYGAAMSILRIGYYWLDYVLGSWVVRRCKSEGRHFVLERGFRDMQVDQRRYRLAVHPRVLKLLAALVPQADLTIILTGDPEEIAWRKQELPVNEIARQLDDWRRIVSGDDRAIEVDVSAPLDQVVATIFEAIQLACSRRAAS